MSHLAGYRNTQNWLTGARPAIEQNQSTVSDRLTLGGLWLLLLGAIILTSGFKVLRPEIGGLRLQLFMLPVALAFPAMLLTRVKKFPAGPLTWLLIFWAMYGFSLIGPATAEMDPRDEFIKLTSAIMAMFTVALLVRNRSDFVLGTLGLTVAISVLAFRGVEEEGQAGFAAANRLIDIGNKNAFSVYALPAVLTAVYVALRTDWKQMWLRRLIWPALVGCTGLTAFVMLTNDNRSGYLGLVVIVVMMIAYVAITPRFHVIGRTWGFILIGIVTAAVIGILIGLRATESFERRLAQTEEGTQSDRLRVDLFWTSIQIGLENPVLGRSPQQLPVELGQRLASYREPVLDTHNLFAHLIGGTGLACATAFLLAAFAFFRWRPAGVRLGQLSSAFFDARNFLRMTLMLFAVRGLFSREVLYNPGFCMAIGLAIGLCIVEGEAAKQSARLPAMSFGQPRPSMPVRP